MKVKQKTSKKTKRKLPTKGTNEFELIHSNAAGIDIASREHFVALPEGRSSESVRKFGCTTPELHKMARWLKEYNIETIAMESTGVYWIPVFQVLETYGFEVYLVDARQTKNVTGRKTDVCDCQWIQKLHSFGLLTPAFRPEDAIVILRTYWRHRANLTQACATQINLMQKSLEQMNVQLHKAISDITGVTGMKMIRAIIDGERDCKRLAQMRHIRVKSSEADIVKALTGDYRDEHLFTLQQAVEIYDMYQEKMEACDHRIASYIKTFKKKGNATEIRKIKGSGKRRKNQPYFDLKGHLYEMTGVDLTKIDGIESLTAMTIITECGIDLNQFKSEKHFSSWLGLCPNNRTSGGKIKTSKTRRITNRAANAFRLAAQSLHSSQTALGAYYRRMRSRLGAPKAITATAHKLAKIVFRLLKHGDEYVDIGMDYYERIYRSRRKRNLINNAKSMGYDIIDWETGQLVS